MYRVILLIAMLVILSGIAQADLINGKNEGSGLAYLDYPLGGLWTSRSTEVGTIDWAGTSFKLYKLPQSINPQKLDLRLRIKARVKDDGEIKTDYDHSDTGRNFSVKGTLIEYWADLYGKDWKDLQPVNYHWFCNRSKEVGESSRFEVKLEEYGPYHIHLRYGNKTANLYTDSRPSVEKTKELSSKRWEGDSYRLSDDFQGPIRVDIALNKDVIRAWTHSGSGQANVGPLAFRYGLDYSVQRRSGKVTTFQSPQIPKDTYSYFLCKPVTITKTYRIKITEKTGKQHYENRTFTDESWAFAFLEPTPVK
jgi:hypothetical protein